MRRLEGLLLSQFDRHLPQFSSASRVTAGALGFSALTKCSVRPDRYGEPLRLLTMPSRPMRHACSKTSGPSAYRCSLSRTPCPGDRAAAPALPCVLRAARASDHRRPARSSRSRTMNTLPSWRQYLIRSNSAMPSSPHAIASPSRMQERERRRARASTMSGKRAVRSLPAMTLILVASLVA
jgi:hypothetical protein